MTWEMNWIKLEKEQRNKKSERMRSYDYSRVQRTDGDGDNSSDCANLKIKVN